MVGYSLDFLTDLGYRARADLSRAAFDGVGLSTNLLEIGRFQGFTHSLDSSVSVCGETMDQVDYEAIIVGKCFKK
jgi:hypothetical protein